MQANFRRRPRCTHALSVLRARTQPGCRRESVRSVRQMLTALRVAARVSACLASRWLQVTVCVCAVCGRVHVCMKESLEARACACLRVCMRVNAIENISFKQPLPQTKHTNTRRCVHRLRGGKVQKCPRIICLSQLRGGQVRERARVCVLHLVRGKCGGTRRRYYLCLRCRYMCTMCVCVCVQCRYVVRLNRIIITVK